MSQVSALHLNFYYIFLLPLMALSGYSERSQQSESCHNFYIVTLSNSLQLNPTTKRVCFKLFYEEIFEQSCTIHQHCFLMLTWSTPFFGGDPTWNLALQGNRAYLRMRSLDQCSRVECLKYCLKMVFCCYQVYWVPTIATGWSFTKTGTSIHSNEQLHLLLNSSLHYKKFHKVPTCYGLIPHSLYSTIEAEAPGMNCA